MVEHGSSSLSRSSDAPVTIPEIPKKIQVSVNIPKNIPESIKRQKVNRIYDILKPKAPRK